MTRGPHDDSSVRWLTDEEQRAWREVVQLLHEIQGSQDQVLEDAHGLSEGEYGVLVSLSEAPDRRMRMCDLAHRLRLSPSGLTRRIDGMVRRGWVAREPNPEDRRVMLAALTDDGFAKLEEAAPTHVAAVRRSLFDHLSSDEVRVLTELLGRARGSGVDAG